LTFNPQYGFWASEDFTSSDGAVYANPLAFQILNGATTYIPSGYIGSVKVFNGIWDPVRSWNIENKIDSLSGLSGNFSTVVTTGYNSNITGFVGYSGLSGQSSFVTDTPSLVYDTVNSYYTSGSAASFVYNADTLSTSQFSNFVLEFSARTLRDKISHSLYTDVSSGVSCHGITIANAGGSETFIEIHPDGLKVHGVTGAILPGDFSSSARRIRIVRIATGSLVIMADDGNSLYVPTGFNTANTSLPLGQYISFGAHPVSTGDVYYSGVTASGFSELNWLLDQSGISGIAGFVGTTLWDDINFKFSDTTYTNPSGSIYSWPTGENLIYSAPWYPSESCNSYLGAVVDSIQVGAGYTKVSAQYLAPSGYEGGSSWTDYDSIVTITNKSDTSTYLDLSKMPIYHGYTNAVRFKIASSGSSSQVPQIDTITVIGKNEEDDFVEVTPNWKLSSLPKNIYFTVDKTKYSEHIPKAHYQDDIFIHNEDSTALYTPGEFIVNSGFNLASGEVMTSLGGDGISRVLDGKYGSAFRNVVSSSGIINSTVAPAYYSVSTGIFIGKLNDSFTFYPAVASLPSTATGTAVCSFSYDTYVGSDGDVLNTQTVNLASWTDASSSAIIGIKLSGTSGGPANDLVNVYEGILSIPKGPGIVASITNGLEEYQYYIDGHNYRTPKEFKCAAVFTGSSSNTSLILGFRARRSEPSGLDPVRWGEWASRLEEHNNSEFTLYSLSGYTATHSYLQFISTGDASRFSYLNDYDIYDTVSYRPVRRGSMLFEGWFRPFGLTGSANSGVLFQTLDAQNRGLQLYLDRSGYLTALVNITYSSASIGNRLDAITNIGPMANQVMYSGISGVVTLAGTSSPIAFGDWNHIGVYQDTRCLGDTYTTTDQPDIADGQSNHGARTSRLYLEVNGNIVNSTDLALPGYTKRIFGDGTVATSYPVGDQYSKCWPRVTAFGITGSRTAVLGKDVICDFDHVRFGIHNTVDARMWSNVLGAKTTPPLFTPWNAIKMPTMVSGEYDHMKYAHIYRFDYPTSYQGWDEGFAINHGIFSNYATSTELTSRGINGSKFFIEKVDDGPKGRSALRLGPGTNMVIPWNSLDERMFNGTGSMSLFWAGNATKAGFYYANSGTYLYNLSSWYTGVQSFEETTANSRVAFGGKFRLHNYPTGTYIGDLMAYEETNAQVSYPRAGIYIAVNSGGVICYGTRRVGAFDTHDGNANPHIVGQFTGNVLPLNEWHHVAIDTKLDYGIGYVSLYFDDQLVEKHTVFLNDDGTTSSISGRPVGYQGLLGMETGTLNSGTSGVPTHKSCFVIGGELPHPSVIRTYQYMDMDVSECYVYMPIGESSLVDSSYSPLDFSYTGDIEINGHYDVSIKNDSTKIASVIGTGQGYNAFYYGKALYPATSFSEAGEHYFYSTSTAGNDPENFKDFGYKLADTNVFNNAESYYVVYEDQEAVKSFGTTDSPIQILERVPPEGVNLALIANKEWVSDNALSAFNLSDQNYANVTNLNGDSTVGSLVKIGGIISGVVSSGSLAAEDVRISSCSVWNDESSNAFVAYFAHLIGGDFKGVYTPSAYSHGDVIGDYDKYYFNKSKIKELIKITDADGKELSFDEFPFDIIISPYSPNIEDYDNGDPEYVDHSLMGYGTINTGSVNADGIFTCTLISPYQTIGKSVFVNYPSHVYKGTVINLQDSEVYNPVPLMKKVEYADGPKDDGTPVIPGSYSINYGTNQKYLDITIWGADLSGWV